jgi:hypothetical protein
MEAINKDWSQIRLRINIKTTVDKAYTSWATQKGLESWFLKKAPAKGGGGQARKTTELLTKADTYLWTWHGYHDDMRHEGTVLEANGKDRFAFSFSSNCPVTVSIYKEQDEVIVELVEDNIPVDNARIFKHYTSNTMGWTFYLTNLKSVLEGGLDLRNFNPSLQNVITA